MKNKEYQYTAFISYKQNDKRSRQIAQKICSLQYTKLPRFFRKKNYKKQIGRVFQDTNNLGNGDWVSALEYSVRQSEYLILICSPSVGDKKDYYYYQNLAVRFFLGMQGKKQIELDGIKEETDVTLCDYGKCFGCEALFSDEEKRKIKECLELTHSLKNRIIPIVIDEEEKTEPDQWKEFCPHNLAWVMEDKAPDRIHKNFFRTRYAGKNDRVLVDKIAAALFGFGCAEGDAIHYLSVQRKRRRRNLLGLFLLFFLLLLSLVWAYSYFFYTGYRYYENYGEPNNQIVGYHELSPDEMKERSIVYRFTYKRYKLRKVERINPCGIAPDILPEWESLRPSVIELEYDDSTGQIVSQKRRYNDDDEEVVWNVSNPERIHFSRGDGKGFSGLALPIQNYIGNLNRSGFLYHQPRRKEEGEYIHYCDVKRKNGLITHMYFKDSDGVSIQNEDGAEGYMYEYDDLSRVKTMYIIDKNGFKIENKRGVSGVKYEYEASSGRLKSMSFVNKDGNSDDGFLLEKIEWKNGNLFSCSFYHHVSNKEKKKCEVMVAGGFHRIEYRYDSFGFVNSIRLFDSEGDACRSEAEGFAEQRIKRTPQHYKSEIAHYKNHKGERCMGNEGFSLIRMNYSKEHSDLITELAFYDEKDRKILCPSGYHRAVVKYNKERKICEAILELIPNELRDKSQARVLGKVEITYGNTTKGGTMEKHVYSNMYQPIREDIIEYDAKGRVLSKQLRDLLNNEIIGKERIEYLSGGSVKKFYCNEKGEACVSDEGWFYAMSEPWKDGYTIERYYDKNGKLFYSDDGYCGILFKERKIKGIGGGTEKECLYVDEECNPCRTISENVYGERVKTDIFKNVVEKSYLNKDGKITCRQPYGFAIIKYKTYKTSDMESRRVESYYDELEVPVMNTPTGSHRMCYVYDESGREKEISYEDIIGQPCKNVEGYYKMTTEYSNSDDSILYRFYDEDGKLVCNANGFAQLKDRKEGSILTLEYYDESNKPIRCNNNCEVYIAENDSENRIISEKFRDSRGNPVTCYNGYHTLQRKIRSILGKRMIETLIYEDAFEDSISCEELEIDEHQRIVRYKVYGKDGNLFNDPQKVSFSMEEYEYTEDGTSTCRFYDSFGNPAKNYDVSVVKRQGAMEKGGYYRELYFDDKEQPTTSESGCYGSLIRFQNESCREIRYLDSEGKPTRDKIYQVYGFLFKYDFWNKLELVESVDSDGNIIHNSRGYAVVKIDRNARTNRKVYSFYNEKNYPCEDIDGVHRVVCIFDEQYRYKEIQYQNLEGKPCQNAKGYSKLVFEKRESPNESVCQGYDINGNMVGEKKNLSDQDLGIQIPHGHLSIKNVEVQFNPEEPNLPHPGPE